MPLLPELEFAPDLEAIPAEALRTGAAAVPQLSQQPHRRDPARRAVRAGQSSWRREHEILVVHDNAYSETTFDGYVAPSFLATPGAKEVGVEVFSLSKGYNMTGWRCAAIVGNAEAIAHYWRLKSNIDSGLFEAVQLAGAAALEPELDVHVRGMNAIYAAPPRPGLRRAGAGGRRGDAARRATIYVWAPVPEGFDVGRGLLRARARAGGRRDLSRRCLRSQRSGVLPHLPDHARGAAARGRRAASRPCERGYHQLQCSAAATDAHGALLGRTAQRPAGPRAPARLPDRRPARWERR